MFIQKDTEFELTHIEKHLDKQIEKGFVINKLKITKALQKDLTTTEKNQSQLAKSHRTLSSDDESELVDQTSKEEVLNVNCNSSPEFLVDNNQLRKRKIKCPLIEEKYWSCHQFIEKKTSQFAPFFLVSFFSHIRFSGCGPFVLDN